MKLRNRFILVGIGMIIFLMITPVVVLYARGFKYDFSKNQIVKTGTLVIKTEPTGASVFLNDELKSDDTPVNIRFIIPGDYNVRIEKSGYQSWTKRLPIRSQFVTWVNEGREFISLFFDTAKRENETSMDYASVSKNRHEVAYISNNELRVIKANNESDDLVSSIITHPLNLDLPLVWDKANQLLNLPEKNLTGVTQIESSEYLTAAISENNLYFFASDGNMKLLDEAVLDMTVEGNTVWYAIPNQIRRINPATSENVVIAEIPSASQVQIIRSANQLFVILDQIIYVVNDELEKIYAPATFGHFDSNSNRLLFGNQNEFLTYNPQTHKFEAILRSLTPISHSTINAETGYIFFVNDHKIKAIELDGRDHRNIYTIHSLNENFSDFIISEDGVWLYVINTGNIEKYKIR